MSLTLDSLHWRSLSRRWVYSRCGQFGSQRGVPQDLSKGKRSLSSIKATSRRSCTYLNLLGLTRSSIFDRAEVN